MWILTTRKPKPNSKTQASKKAKSQQPQQQLYYPYQPYTQNTTPQLYSAPAPTPIPSTPPPPATKHTTFYLSKPKKGNKLKIKKKPKPRPQSHQEPTMSNDLAPWVAINAYAIPPQVAPPPQMPHRGNYQTFPADWAYVDQFEQVQFLAERNKEFELHRYRQREDILQDLLIDSFSSRKNNENQDKRPDTACSDLRNELKDLRKEFDDQKRARELNEALEKGRKEGAEAAKKEKEKANEAAKEQSAKWEMERERGTIKRSRGTGRGFGIEARMEDLDIYERALVRGRQGFLPTSVKRPGGYDPPLAYGYEADEFGYGYGYGNASPPSPPVRRGYSGAGDLDVRLKDIESSQRRMEERFRAEDLRREWEREHRQEDILLRVNDNVARFGRKFDGY